MRVDVSRATSLPRLRLVLVKLLEEECSGKDVGKFGLLKKSIYKARDAASNSERDWRGHRGAGSAKSIKALNRRISARPPTR